MRLDRRRRSRSRNAQLFCGRLHRQTVHVWQHQGRSDRAACPCVDRPGAFVAVGSAGLTQSPSPRSNAGHDVCGLFTHSKHWSRHDAPDRPRGLIREAFRLQAGGFPSAVPGSEPKRMCPNQTRRSTYALSSSTGGGGAECVYWIVIHKRELLKRLRRTAGARHQRQGFDPGFIE